MTGTGSLPGLTGLDSQAALFSGAPDPQLIARLANQLFQSLPGQAAPSVGVALPGVPAGVSPPVETPIPVAGQITPVAAVPQLGPVASGPAAPPINPTSAPPFALPGESQLRELAFQLSHFTDLVPDEHLREPVAKPSGDAADPGYYFLDPGHGLSHDTPVKPSYPVSEPPRPDAIALPAEHKTDFVPDQSLGGVAFNPAALKRDFPILQQKVHGRDLIWLDNGATTQKPRQVIDRISRFYETENSNIHRAAHTLAARSTDAYEAARDKVRRFINAGSTNDIIFVRGATEGINLVAKAWGGRHLNKGDEIVVTHLEHHANIVPWQQLAAERGAIIRVAPVDDDGQIILEEYEKLLNPRTRIVALTQVSNALGTVTPIQAMVSSAHRYGAVALVDGAQSVSHMPIDVQALDADFFVFSGHKMFAPTGIGVVYGKPDVLEATPPWQGGGNMIADVTFERTIYQGPPSKFEAGTGNIADAVGLGAAIDYLTQIGMANISAYEHGLLEYATPRLLNVPGLKIIGTAKEKAGVLSFVLNGVRTEDIGGLLDREGIAVRAGHHCAQPILRRFGLEATVRASLAFYNLCEDIDALVAALHRITTRAHGR